MPLWGSVSFSVSFYVLNAFRFKTKRCFKRSDLALLHTPFCFTFRFTCFSHISFWFTFCCELAFTNLFSPSPTCRKQAVTIISLRQYYSSIFFTAILHHDATANFFTCDGQSSSPWRDDQYSSIIFTIVPYHCMTFKLFLMRTINILHHVNILNQYHWPICFTNIIHRMSSQMFFTNVPHQYSSMLTVNIHQYASMRSAVQEFTHDHQYSSSIVFVNILREYSSPICFTTILHQ